MISPQNADVRTQTICAPSSKKLLTVYGTVGASLDTDEIREDFKTLYRNMWNGAKADFFAQAELAGLLVTASLRKEVLNSLSTELQDKLTEPKARSKTLAKKLGQKPNV